MPPSAPSPLPTPGILRALDTLGPASPVALLMRHSERLPVLYSAHYDVPLTENGRRMAHDLGRALAPRGRIVLYHSFIPRCGETASCIADGAREAGAEATVIGVLDDLAGPYLKDRDAVMDLADTMTPERFLRAWFDGALPEAILAPLHEAAASQLRPVHLALGRHPDALSVLVSHDWNLMTVREACLGARHEDVGWLPFLDGVAATPAANGGLTLAWADRRATASHDGSR